MSEESGQAIEHPLIKMQRQAEKARQRREKERVYCPKCDTEVLKDDIEDAVEVAENHDESRHGGERTAKVNGMLVPSDEVVEAVEEALSKITEGDDGE